MSDDHVQSCQSCGATVYPEHLASGKAAVLEGVLRCPHCAAEYATTHHVDEQRYTGQTSARAPGEGMDVSAVTLVQEAAADAESRTIHGFSSMAMSSAGLLDDEKLRRPLLTTGTAATRCRTFHAKLNDGAVAFMNQQLNEWVDAHPDITIKHASSTLGIWEGKKAEPTLILTIFY